MSVVGHHYAVFFGHACPADVQAAEYYMQFQYGWMADPIYFGDYPKIMLETQVGNSVTESE